MTFNHRAKATTTKPRTAKKPPNAKNGMTANTTTLRESGSSLRLERFAPRGSDWTPAGAEELLHGHNMSGAKALGALRAVHFILNI